MVLKGTLAEITKNFSYAFENSGLMFDRKFVTTRTSPAYEGKRSALGDHVLKVGSVPKEYFIDKADLPRWKYLKGAKKEERSSKSGFKYTYNEGPMTFPDELGSPSRTIITAEGGSTPSRFKHVIKQNGRYRRLTPIELERLCMFPDNHTAHPVVADTKRAFFMGNALVVGVIEKLGRALLAADQGK